MRPGERRHGSWQHEICTSHELGKHGFPRGNAGQQVRCLPQGENGRDHEVRLVLGGSDGEPQGRSVEINVHDALLAGVGLELARAHILGQQVFLACGRQAGVVKIVGDTEIL